eukprot:g962.t1
MFPCESAYSGFEVQGVAGSPGKEGPWGYHEQHFSSDIAFAGWQYWQAQASTGSASDEALLRDGIEPFVRGVADFWASRVRRRNHTQARTSKGTAKGEAARAGSGSSDSYSYVIEGVMGPDEYHDLVNNSAFTNYGAKTIITAAIAAAHAAGRAPGANWSDIVAHMYVPFDEAAQYHPEFDGYQRGTKVKQADTVLIGFPYADANLTLSSSGGSGSGGSGSGGGSGSAGDHESAAVRAHDLEAYAPYTDVNGPAMTWSIFALGWIDVLLDEASSTGGGGQENATLAARALSFFEQGYANSQPPFGVWTETPRGGTVNFITGAGGFLQSVLFGYAGLRLRPGRLDLRPPSPPAALGCSGLRVRLRYRGHALEVVVKRATLSLLGPLTEGATAISAPRQSGRRYSVMQML